MRGACTIVAISFAACRGTAPAPEQVPPPKPSPVAADASIVDVGVAGTRGRHVPPAFGPIPEGRFVAVVGGNDMMCALDGDGRAACWGTSDLIAKVPAEPIAEISMGSVRLCVRLRSGGAVRCWGFEQTPPPATPLEAITAGTAQCGLDEAHQIVCWGDAKQAPPKGPVRSVSSGEATSCAVLADGHVRCWLTWGYIADHRESVAPPTDGDYETVVVGYEHGCALKRTGEARCWGRDVAGETRAPEGRFKQLTLGEKRTCGLGLDGSVTCWGGEPDPAPAGLRFDRIAMTTDEDLESPTYLCGIDPSHHLTCWSYGGTR